MSLIVILKKVFKINFMKDTHDRGFKYFWIVLKKNKNTLLMLKIRVKLSFVGS